MSVELSVTALCLVVLVIVFFVFAGIVSGWPKNVSVPVGLKVVLLGRDAMADVLTYQVSVGPAVDHDVVSRELSFVIDGADPVVASFPGSTTDLGLVSAPQGSSIVLSLVDIDDAGNRSDAATLEFVAADTLPPAVPGAFGVTLVGESPAPEVTPEPPVEG
jgi:hypothetical protein